MNQVLEGFPIEHVRKQFPSLGRKHAGSKNVVYFDGPGGSQMAQQAMDNMIHYIQNGMANLHGVHPTSVETDNVLATGRKAMADLLDVKENEVAFGANMTTLTLAIARAISREWKNGDEIIVTELDHRANVDPWITAAEDKGVTVRWLKVDPKTLTLKLDDLDHLLNDKTKLVAIGMASNGIGTISDVAEVAKQAKSVGALVAVDAVHAVPHVLVDRDQLQADILLCSAYKFFGPHVGIAAIRESLFEEILPYKLKPAPAHYPDKLETGTQNHEGIAGVIGAVDFIASLGEGASRREQIVSAYDRIETYENGLVKTLREELAAMNGVTVYQSPESVAKTPTIAFNVEGHNPRDVCRYLTNEHGLFLADGDFYASTLGEVLGLSNQGGFVRAGLAPYNTLEEIERLVSALKEMI